MGAMELGLQSCARIRPALVKIGILAVTTFYVFVRFPNLVGHVRDAVATLHVTLLFQI